MTIPSITNTQTAGVQNTISRTLETSSGIANKLSSGQRILYAYEDPAGLAIGTKLEVDLAVFKEALKSANQASVVLNIAYGGAKSITDILKRLNQLSIMALTGSAADSDRKLINLEAQQLIQEVDRTATSTNFNGRKLIDGSTAEVKVDTVGLELPKNIPASNSFEFKFTPTQVESSIGAANVKIEYKSNAFQLTVGGTDAVGTNNANAVYLSGDKAATTGDYNKALFRFGGSKTDVSDIKDKDGKTLFIFNKATGEVKEGDGTSGVVLWNYKDKPSSAFEFRFNGSKNVIIDGTGTVELIKYDEVGKKFTLNKDSSNNINNAYEHTAYKYDVSTQTVQSLDGTKTYFKIDNPDNVQIIDKFKIDDGSGSTKDGSLTLSSDGTIKNQGGTQIFSFDPTKQEAEPMIFQIGTETTDKIEIALDGVKASDLEVDQLDLTTFDKAEEARVAVEKALDIMFEYNATIGAYQSRFRMVAAGVSTSIENVDAARAEFLDADFTELTKQFSQESAKLTASITAEAKLIQTPQQLLALLQYM